MHADRRLPRALAVASIVLLVACSPIGGSSSGNRIVTPAPAPKPTRSAATPSAVQTPDAATSGATSSVARLRGEGLSSGELYTAYRAILDTYVDPVDNTQLIGAATASLRKQLREQSTLPLLTLPLSLAGAPTGSADKDWQAFGDAYDAVVTKMPTWAQQAHPDWLVLRGMADSLHDGHTTFMTPDEARRSRETSFAGIGVVMSRPQDNQPPLISEIFPNSPAASSGLKRGDRIVGVDGQDVTGQSVGDIAGAIRGQPGTTVRVQVSRLNAGQPLEFTMRRALVQVEQVIGRLIPAGPTGYLKIRGFSDPSMVEQVLGILDQGHQRGIRGWIVDLRGNPGGSLPALIGVASGFFDASHAVIGYQVDRQRRQTPLQLQQALNLLAGAPLVVLIDRDTASGAEIFAASIQEAQIGTLVGGKTAGNVAVATQISLSDDSVLQLTEQRFVSPSGAQLDGVGVTPDVVVDLTDEDLQNDRDPQFARAVELVIQKISAAGG